jgi:hypothetical protein
VQPFFIATTMGHNLKELSTTCKVPNQERQNKMSRSLAIVVATPPTPPNLLKLPPDIRARIIQQYLLITSRTIGMYVHYGGQTYIEYIELPPIFLVSRTLRSEAFKAAEVIRTVFENRKGEMNAVFVKNVPGPLPYYRLGVDVFKTRLSSLKKPLFWSFEASSQKQVSGGTRSVIRSKW